MEFLSILLSSLLFIGSPTGVALDQIAANAIRARVDNVEDLEVRVDNGSAVQLLQGKVDRLRIGARGVSLVPGFRIAIADIETDPIDLDVGALQQGRVVLDRPFQGAVHLVLTAEDLNTFLQSPAFLNQLSSIRINLDNASQNREVSRYRLENPKVTFLGNNRLRVEIDLFDQVLEESLPIEAETGLTVENGHRLVLLDPRVVVDGEAAPDQLLDTFTESLDDQLSLRQFEPQGITARVLSLAVEPEGLDLALWVQIDPSFTN
ncbi:MAG: DUF2993 domain-containing protein [Cyanobacteria bacterium J06632_22]